MKKGKFSAIGAVILLLLLFWLYRGSSDSSSELSSAGQNSSPAAVSMQADSDSNLAESAGSELMIAEPESSESDASESAVSESETSEGAAPNEISEETAEETKADGSEGSIPRDSKMEAKILAAAPLDEDGYYYSEQDVATYLYQYGKLPSNYITKTKARKLGWDGGSVDPYKAGGAIGGGGFTNSEGVLPEVDGSSYHECDIDTDGSSSRGKKRIVYSDDGRIYYTADHYESFVQLLGPSVS